MKEHLEDKEHLFEQMDKALLRGVHVGVKDNLGSDVISS